MKRKLISGLALAGFLAAAPTAFAVPLKGFDVQKEMTATMKNGKRVQVKVGTMNGKTYVLAPMEDFEDLYRRAEGHSMATGP